MAYTKNLATVGPWSNGERKASHWSVIGYIVNHTFSSDNSSDSSSGSDSFGSAGFADSDSSSGSINETRMSLILNAKANDPEAWADIFHIYGPLVARWVSREGVSCPADIDNYSQEAFVHMFSGIQSFEKSKPSHSFRGWFRRITQNVIRTDRRRVKATGTKTCLDWDWSRVQVIEFAEDSGDFFDSIADDHPDEKRVIYRQIQEWVFKNFKPKQVALFRAVILSDCPPADLAAELSVPLSWVYVTKSRMLKRIRQRFKGKL